MAFIRQIYVPKNPLFSQMIFLVEDTRLPPVVPVHPGSSSTFSLQLIMLHEQQKKKKHTKCGHVYEMHSVGVCICWPRDLHGMLCVYSVGVCGYLRACGCVNSNNVR